MNMKTSLGSIITLLIFLTVTTAFSQKLTREEVESKLTKSWTATETGNPGEALSPKRHKEIMNFKPDGSLTIVQYTEIMGNTTANVLWGFDETKQKIIMTLATGGLSETQELEILELTNNKLVLMSPEKQTVYIPTENTQQGANSTNAITTNETFADEGLNPEAWSGKLVYNIIFKMDDNDDQSEERVPGVITLEILGEKKIIRKKELGSTVTWTIEAETSIANTIHYTVVSSDLNLNGEISFQKNGFMLLEIYEPKYMSYLWAAE